MSLPQRISDTCHESVDLDNLPDPIDGQTGCIRALRVMAGCGAFASWRSMVEFAPAVLPRREWLNARQERDVALGLCLVRLKVPKLVRHAIMFWFREAEFVSTDNFWCLKKAIDDVIPRHVSGMCVERGGNDVDPRSSHFIRLSRNSDFAYNFMVQCNPVDEDEVPEIRIGGVPVGTFIRVAPDIFELHAVFYGPEQTPLPLVSLQFHDACIEIPQNKDGAIVRCRRAWVTDEFRREVALSRINGKGGAGSKWLCSIGRLLVEM